MSTIPKIAYEQSPQSQSNPKNSPPRPLYINRDTLLNHPIFLAEKKFQRWSEIVKKYIAEKERKREYAQAELYKKYGEKAGTIPRPSVKEYTSQLVQQGKLPHDYDRKVILRQLALGCQHKEDLLLEHNIILYDKPKLPAHRRQYENRQPAGPADFVLIDPLRWQGYVPLQRFYDKLPAVVNFAVMKNLPPAIARKENILKYGYIQPNHNKYWHCLVFDLDDKGQQWNWNAWREAGLPPPNIIIKNPSKADSCQYIYLLEKPVFSENEKAKKFYEDLSRCMRERLGGDIHFNRKRMKNPFSHEHDCFVSGAKLYSLSELAEQCDLELERSYRYSHTTQYPKSLETAEKAVNDSNIYKGRNDETFHANRPFGYANASLEYQQLYKLVALKVLNYQRHFANPLPDNEIHSIAKSITDYCKRTDFGKGGIGVEYSQQARERFVARQKFKAKCRWGDNSEKKTQALKMLKKGDKISDIAKSLSVTRQTLARWGVSKKK